MQNLLNQRLSAPLIQKIANCQLLIQSIALTIVGNSVDYISRKECSAKIYPQANYTPMSVKCVLVLCYAYLPP